ncbi:MAG: O-antigen ligase family protein [Pseudomarimonas sp.]
MATEGTLSTRLLWLAAAALLTSALALGGGTRQALPAESALQLFALILGACSLFAPNAGQLPGRSLLVFGWVFCLVTLVATQLIPLPAAIWQQLAGRGALAQELELAGVAIGARPISVDPAATLRALLALLPPIVMLGLVARLDLDRRIRLLKWVLMLGLASCVLGFAQLAGGPSSELRWHAVTSTTNAVGAFANRNHLASLLSLCLPLATAWLMVSYYRAPRDQRPAWLLMAVFALILLVVGLAVTRSRAGVLLGIAAFAGIAVMAWLFRRRMSEGRRRDQKFRRWLLLAAIIGMAISMQYGLADLLSRLKTDPLEDKRWTTAINTLDAIDNFGVLGAGAGTFPSVYPSVEPPEQRSEYYVNRAHNDWLEWTLEGGLPMVVLILFGLALLARLGVDALQSPSSRAPWRWASLLGIGLLLIHSLIDYPLRTTALSVVAALLVGCLMPELSKPPPATSTGLAPPDSDHG